MLIGISPLISPELLNVLYRMGHGDTLVLADAHFPCDTVNNKVVRADGLKIDDLLNAILPLFALDSYINNPVRMMAPVSGDKLDPDVEARYWKVIDRHWPDTSDVERVERFEFYDQAKDAFAVISTGETAKYGNILITKGVTPAVCGDKG